MSIVLLGIGVVLILAGLYFLFKPPPGDPPAPTGKPEALPDIGAWLEKLQKLLEAFDKRLRTGILLVLLGTAFCMVAVYVDVNKTKNKVVDATKTSLVIRSHHA